MNGIAQPVKTLNAVFSSLSTRRRYEVWFLRMGLADGSGAWWFRYLLMNPGRGGCPGSSQGMPVQTWATWFPKDSKPQTFIQGWPVDGLELSAKANPFHFRIADNAIDENSCSGTLRINGHDLSWDLRYSSTFGTTLSNKGWIGFSRTPHSNAVFSGNIILDGRSFEGSPLGYGLQGHNCGYRHRDYWIWTHAFFGGSNAPSSTLEALIYEMPFGLVFRKAVLWHGGRQHVFENLRESRTDPQSLNWEFSCRSRDGLQLEVAIDGSGPALHSLPYFNTNCSGSFKVINNSFAKASMSLHRPDGTSERLETSTGSVLEMGGRVPEASQP